MSTEAADTILNRQRSLEEAKDEIAVLSPLLQEAVNYATQVVERCSTCDTEDPVRRVVLCLYLHIIEMTDAVQLLVASSCPDPAKLLLRSSLEAVLSINYILKDQSELRALSWLHEFYIKEIRFCRSHDSTTNEGKELRQSLKKDRFWAASDELKLSEDLKESWAFYDNQLNLPQFEPIKTEYKRLKKERKDKGGKGSPKWYEMFGSTDPCETTPRNLEQLAQHLKLSGMYDAYYRTHSSLVHGRAAARFYLGMDHLTSEDPLLRGRHHVVHVTRRAVNLLSYATCMVSARYLPEERERYCEWKAELLKTLSNFHADPSEDTN